MGRHVNKTVVRHRTDLTPKMLEAAVSILRAGGAVKRSRVRVVRAHGRIIRTAAQYVGAEDRPLETRTINLLLARGFARSSFTTGVRMIELTVDGTLASFREWERRRAERDPLQQTLF